MQKMIFTLLLMVIFFKPVETQADDWPQWRGPERDGVWYEEGIIQNLENLKVLWRSPISNGYSGPTVSDGRVYITDRIESNKELERVHCFDEKTGNVLWTHAYACKYKVGYPNGPRASVIIDDDRAYSLGSMGHLYCFDKKTGRVIWNRDLNTDYEIRMPIWGIAAAPIIYGDLIILQIGGEDNACIIALDKQTGKHIWNALPDKASYSAPIIIEQAGQDVLVCLTGENLVGLNPESGNVYWQQPFPPNKMIISIATPVLYKNFILVSSFFDGSLLVKLDDNQPACSKVWLRKGKNERNTDALHCCISTPLIKDDYIYGVDSYGELRCLDLFTGDRIWENLQAVNKARWANIHMVQNGHYTWMFNEHGELIISILSPEGFKQISRAQLIEPTTGQLSRSGTGVCWAHPAFANKKVFIRNDKEILCVDLAKR